MIRFLFLVLVIASLAVSCSSTEEKSETKEKVYSEETNRAFEMIERGYNPQPIKKAPVSINPPQVSRPIVEAQNRETKKVVTKVKPVESKGKTSDKIIELNQNLAFYCMKHSKDPIFKNDEKRCMDHVERILESCQKRSSNNDSKTLSCVKNRLGRKL